jgi:hypothetical protein
MFQRQITKYNLNVVYLMVLVFRHFTWSYSRHTVIIESLEFKVYRKCLRVTYSYLVSWIKNHLITDVRNSLRIHLEPMNLKFVSSPINIIKPCKVECTEKQVLNVKEFKNFNMSVMLREKPLCFNLNK